MGPQDIDQCAAQLDSRLEVAVSRVLGGLESPDQVLSEAMLTDLGIAATEELAVEAPWARSEFRVEAVENAAQPGKVVFQPAPLTAWAREVLTLAGKLADEAEEARTDAGRGQD
jgi:hypothetical protein